jgi:hypothetical protein
MTVGLAPLGAAMGERTQLLRPLQRPEDMRPLVLLVLALLLVACSAPGDPSSPTPVVTVGGSPPNVMGVVTSGPVCPVERNPPDPSCAPRPVAGAVIVATDASGQEVARAATATDGSYMMTVSGTGTFVITGLAIAGLLGVPAPATVTLAYPSTTVHVDLRYDTGIR